MLDRRPKSTFTAQDAAAVRRRFAKIASRATQKAAQELAALASTAPARMSWRVGRTVRKSA